MPDQTEEPPFVRIGPAAPASPVIISVPHAGRNYSQALLRSARVPKEKLETLEDRLVDRLVWRALADGAVAIIARTPRAEIDLNRDEREIDPSTVVPPLSARDLLQSPRTRGGLGLIPSRIAGAGAIWLHRTPQDEVRRRIEGIHRPYHEAIRKALEQARAAFGCAILLDCHSMPPRDATGFGAAPIVFGDRHGTSAGRQFVDAAVAAARRAGYAAVCNTPYAGGYVTSHHGRPAENIHAIQLEIDRSLYLTSDLREPGPRFDAVAELVADVAAALADCVPPAVALAAE